MKRIVISIVILSLIAGLCGWSVVEVIGKTESFAEKVRTVEKACEDGDNDTCVEVAEELQNEWLNFMNKSVLINDLGHALDITTSIAEIYSFALSDNQDEIFAACDRAETQLDIFKTMQLPTLWKIL